MITNITCGCDTPDIETLPVLVARPSGSMTVPGVKMLRCDTCRWAVMINDAGDVVQHLNPSTPRPTIATPELDDFIERTGIAETVIDKVYEFISDNPVNSKGEDWTPSGIARKVKTDTQHVWLVLEYLVRRGEISSCGNGKWTRYYGGRTR